MEEKTYHLLNRTGAASIVLGIIVTVVGVTTGVITIVNGARLIHGKKYISF